MSCYQFESKGLALKTLLRHLPMGVAWMAWHIPGKVSRRLMDAIADAYEDMTRALCRLVAELDPRTTTQMITEWETALGLPDPCLPQANTLEERRFWVLWRLDKRRYTTSDDWQYLASLFGLRIHITPGWYVQEPALYQAIYPKRYDNFPKLGRFRVYINLIGLGDIGYDYGSDGRGPGYPVPYGFDSDDYSRFKCLIERVKPANVVVVWDFPLGSAPYLMCIGEEFDPEFSTEFCVADQD